MTTSKPHSEQEFLHAFIDGAEPGWDASVRHDAHEKVRSLFEQLETLRELLANGAEIATHYMDTDGRGDLDGWIAAAQDALSNPASEPEAS